jgi:hypothetical protein
VDNLRLSLAPTEARSQFKRAKVGAEERNPQGPCCPVLLRPICTGNRTLFALCLSGQCQRVRSWLANG